MTDVRFVLLRHARDNVLDQLNEREMEWTEFCSWLVEEGHELRGVVGDPSAFEGEYKNGQRGANRPAGMVLADPRWDEPAMDDDVDLDFIERKGTEGVLRRAKRNFVGACAAVAIDLDDLTVADYEALTARLVKYDAVEYSTYSHGKSSDKVKLRLIVRLDREQTADEVSRVRRGSGVLLDVRVDTQTVDISRIFYLPAAHPDRSEQAFIRVHTGGASLSVDACLAEAPVTERDMLGQVEIVWDGVTPASPKHQTLARAELDDWISRCGRMVGDDSKRKWLLQRTMKFGSYIKSGCLPGEETRKLMHDRVRELMKWAWDGDDHSVEYRIAQVDKGLADGLARGGRLPIDQVEALKEVIAEQAADLSIPDHIAEKLVELPGTARRDLMNNIPDTLVSLEEARQKSFEFGMQLKSRELLVDSSSAGTGKSYNMAKIASARAREGLQVVIQTRENTVGAQTREQMDPDIRHVQLYSPLSPPAQAPASHLCPRSDALSYLRGSGTPIRAVCTRCPLNEKCAALEAHRERMEALTEAQVVFVSQAGIGQAQELLDDGALLMTDEQPDTGEFDTLSDETLEAFQKGQRMHGVPEHVREILSQVAGALLEKNELPELPDMPPKWDVDKGAYDNTHFAQEKIDNLKISRKLWSVFTREHQWSRIGGEARIWKLDRAHVAMVTYGGLLCDATPFKPAFPRDMEIRELRQHVKDRATVTRHIWVANRSGSSGLFPGGEVDQQRLEQMLTRMCHYADRTGAKSALLVTFKKIEEWITENRSALTLPPGFEMAHFGAVRGKNRWKDFELIYVFGTPRFNRLPLLEHLVKDSARVREEWERCASSELEQALARLRPVSRTTPCTMVCESEVVPRSWYATMERFEIRLLPEDEVRGQALTALLAWSASGVTQTALAEALKVDQSTVSRWLKRRTSIPREKVYLILSTELARRFSPEEPDPAEAEEMPDLPEEEPEIPVDDVGDDVVECPDVPEDCT